MNEASEGKMSIRYHSFLNSGLLIRVSLLMQDTLFDEELFDYSDHDFFYRLSKERTYVNVIDLELEHSLSSFDNADAKKVFDRFLMLRKASLKMGKKHRSFFPIIWFALRAFKLSFITKNSIFIKSIVK